MTQVAFTYLIGWTCNEKYYYGVRYKQGCSPADLWTTYFTSSKHVANQRKIFGEPDIVKVRRTFTSIEAAKEWEHRCLRRLKIRKRNDFLNRTDNKCLPSRAGSVVSDATKAKMSASHKGRKFSAEHRAKISAARKGQRNSLGHVPSEQQRENMRQAQLLRHQKYPVKDETRRKIGIANSKKASSVTHYT